ncbi:PhoX family protein [Corynebacterium pelargi]|uniref:Uncharacterized protein n=1 Tax=Corynebacterium pelargi TaxID=1471400 RepID=A0A410WB28_9CORY|nr:PhoX family phosphatase [Corynebacterium pelargi]QAU53149.1 hypothetical protein CPELA_09470 [Corynebacterium pelargi]GGG74563.1 phosphatase [Corynebacterium pelargi]
MGIKGLNLLSSFASSRSAKTCEYKCGNACLGEPTNQSNNQYFGAIVSRRGILKGSGVAVASLAGAQVLAACGSEGSSAASSTAQAAASSEAKNIALPQGMNFPVVEPNKKDEVVVPEGYDKNVLIAWGDPMFEGVPEFDINNQTAANAERQFGFNNDFAGLMDHPSDDNRMVYVCSHEYTTEPHMFPGYDVDNPTDEQINIGLANHGQSVLEVSKVGDKGELKREFGPLNRRITATTPMKIQGVLAGTEYVKTKDDPQGTTVLGTIANCSGGMTPWGTYLSGEENFEPYFANYQDVKDEQAKKYCERLGSEEGPTLRQWERLHERFDLAKQPNEINRFGYLVEIDPLDPNSVPVKHTSAGRFKHESGNIYVTSDGTVVCYTGDDARFEYIYKFVSSRKIKEGDTAHNMGILDYGTLYVGKLDGNSPEKEIDGSGELPSDGLFDGQGTWVPLLTVDEDGAKSHIDGMSPEEVAVYTRFAADEAGATKMDRPEDFEANKHSGKVYVALTNNSYRGATGKDAKKNKEDAKEWAPITENKNGLVMELDDDHAGEKFKWNILLVCGDPEAAYSYFGGFDKSKVSPISCPDNLAFDDHGNLWISSDGNALGSNDGLYAVGLEGENRGNTRCFLTVPTGAETCGPIVTKDRVLVNVQHPGETDEATVENPASHWPDGGKTPPRPGVAVVWNPKGKIGEGN